MNEAKYLLMNYGDPGGCYRSALTDNILRDLHINSSYDRKAEFNDCFMIHSK